MSKKKVAGSSLVLKVMLSRCACVLVCLCVCWGGDGDSMRTDNNINFIICRRLDFGGEMYVCWFIETGLIDLI